MTTNYTALIQYSKDLDIEYNIKFIFIFLITTYVLAGIWWVNRKEPELLWQYLTRKVFFAFSIAYFTFLPLFTVALFRTFKFDVLLMMLLTTYIVLFSFVPIMFLLGYGEVILKFIFKILGKEDWGKLMDKKVYK